MLDNLAAELSFWRWVATHFDEYMELHASADELATLTPLAVGVQIQHLEATIAREAQRKEPTHVFRTPTYHPLGAAG